MKVLGIAGSPRRGGNTEILLDEALRGAESAGAETEKIILNDLVFRPCQACGGCDNTGKCVIEDGMKEVYKKVKEADAVILAAPVFFGSLSAQTKMMIDRFQCKWVETRVLKRIRKEKRPGIFLAAEATDRRDFFENARAIVKHFFSVAGISYTGELFCPLMEKKGDVKKHPEFLQKAFDLGTGLVK